MTEVASYYHVLVVGAVKTGKTTLLANLCHSQQGDYEPTIYAQKFVDTHRKLVFIDTPGIKDIILTQGSGLNDHTQGRFASFSDDSLVRELRGAYMDQSQYRLLADPYISNKLVNNMNSIDAVLIVYTDDKQSQQMVRALPQRRKPPCLSLDSPYTLTLSTRPVSFIRTPPRTGQGAPLSLPPQAHRGRGDA
jgi:hypothetical protein